jgi:hypothetical protein
MKVSHSSGSFSLAINAVTLAVIRHLMPARSLITLTTDFGHGSPYVAKMKGVILSLCRQVDLVTSRTALGRRTSAKGQLCWPM